MKEKKKILTTTKNSIENFNESSLKQLNETNTNSFNLTFLNLLRKYFKNSSRYDSTTNETLLNKFESLIYKLTPISSKNIKKAEFQATKKSNSKVAELNQYLTLNFEYSFFSLIKMILVDEENLVGKEEELILLMNFCLRKCMTQYELFKSTIGETSDDDQDELNILEL